MTQALIDNLPLIADAPDGIKALRGLILDLAVRGKLVPQDPEDEPASELLKRIAAEKVRLVKMGQIKNEKGSAGHTADVPFSPPNGWEWARLGNILLKITDGTHHSPVNTTSGEFMYVSAKNIKAEGVIVEGITYVTKEVHEEIYSRCNPELGDILYVKDGATTGVATINNIPDQFSMLSSVALLKAGSLVLNKYILHVLRSPLLYCSMRSEMTGVAITRVTLAKLNNAIVPLPPLAEQHRIVAKVDELMALCDRLEAQQADAEAVHATLVKTLLDTLTQSQDADDFTANWYRLSQHFPTIFTTEASVNALKQTVLSLGVSGKLSDRMADDGDCSEIIDRAAKIISPAPGSSGEACVGREIPEHWKWVSLGAITDIGTGSTPSRSQPRYWGGTIPWVASGLTSRPIIDATEECVTEEGRNASRLRIYPPGTLLVALYGQGKTRGQVSELRIGATVNQAIAAICILPGLEGMRDYLKLVLFENYERMRALSAGGAQPNLNLGKISALPIPLPPLGEQHRIVATVNQLLTLCDTLKARIAESRTVQRQLAVALVEQTLAA